MSGRTPIVACRTDQTIELYISRKDWKENECTEPYALYMRTFVLLSNVIYGLKRLAREQICGKFFAHGVLNHKKISWKSAASCTRQW
jgi:hypothetical protein